LGHLDLELGGLGVAVEDVERHVRRRRPAREPGEAADAGLHLLELLEGAVAVGAGDAGIEHVDERRIALASWSILRAALGLEQERRLLERHLAVRVAGVPGLKLR